MTMRSRLSVNPASVTPATVRTNRIALSAYKRSDTLFITRNKIKKVAALRPRYKPLQTSLSMPSSQARGAPTSNDSRKAIKTMITSNRSGLKDERIKRGSSDTWMIIAARTKQINSRAARLLIPTPLHDQNFFEMGQVNCRANRYVLEDAVFSAFDHGNFANRKPF